MNHPIHKRNDYRDISRVRGMNNTSRILNLNDIWLKRKELADIQAAAAAEAARAAGLASPASEEVNAIDPPRKREDLFRNAFLNRAIYIKHNLRPHERELFKSPKTVETKIFVAFDPTQLEEGGRYVFVGERQYERVLDFQLGLDPTSQSAEDRRDLQVLSVLSTIPSFDAFIIKERLRAERIEIDPDYFADAYKIEASLTTKIFDQFRPLVEKALGSQASEAQLSRIVNDVWNTGADTKQSAFLSALQIPQEYWLEVVFAWKASIFYQLQSHSLMERVKTFLDTLGKIRVLGAVGRSHEIDRLRKRLAKAVVEQARRALSQVEAASQAMAKSVEGTGDAGGVRDSLMSLRRDIFQIGVDYATVDHILAFWAFRFGGPARRTIQVDEYEMLVEDTIQLMEMERATNQAAMAQQPAMQQPARA